MLCADQPKTVTSALVWLGLQDQDWSWSYQALSSPTWRMHELFDPLLEDALRLRPILRPRSFPPRTIPCCARPAAKCPAPSMPAIP